MNNCEVFLVMHDFSTRYRLSYMSRKTSLDF